MAIYKSLYTREKKKKNEKKTTLYFSRLNVTKNINLIEPNGEIDG
jgi:hypothetical protein